MTLTILFDLDDTLLQTNIPDFIPEYFNELGQAFANLASTKQITQQVQYAVKCMEANQDPAIGLHEIFSRNFYQPLGSTEAEQQETLTNFYNEVYPKLQSVTTQITEAPPLINWCKAQGFSMAIATNPLFPETATRQRIEWAGLQTEDFEFFTTFNNFHFTKPNLTYYAECLGKMGWPEDQIVMIGDSLSHDLIPVETFGYPTFWITPMGVLLIVLMVH